LPFLQSPLLPFGEQANPDKRLEHGLARTPIVPAQIARAHFVQRPQRVAVPSHAVVGSWELGHLLFPCAQWSQAALTVTEYAV
jgi:hypothetical protein